MFGTRGNDICQRDHLIIEPRKTTFIENFGCLQKSMVIYDTRNIQDRKSPPSDAWKARRETASSFQHP